MAVITFPTISLKKLHIMFLWYSTHCQLLILISLSLGKNLLQVRAVSCYDLWVARRAHHNCWIYHRIIKIRNYFKSQLYVLLGYVHDLMVKICRHTKPQAVYNTMLIVWKGWNLLMIQFIQFWFRKVPDFLFISLPKYWTWV